MLQSLKSEWCFKPNNKEDCKGCDQKKTHSAGSVCIDLSSLRHQTKTLYTFQIQKSSFGNRYQQRKGAEIIYLYELFEIIETHLDCWSVYFQQNINIKHIYITTLPFSTSLPPNSGSWQCATQLLPTVCVFLWVRQRAEHRLMFNPSILWVLTNLLEEGHQGIKQWSQSRNVGW